MSNIQARAPTEAVIPKYVQPKTILSLDIPSDLNQTDFLYFDNVSVEPSSSHFTETMTKMVGNTEHVSCFCKIRYKDGMWF